MFTSQNEDLEISSLACLVKDGSCFSRVEDILNKKTYVNPINQIVFTSIRELYNNDVLPDKVTIIVDLQRRGILDNIVVSGLKGKEAVEYLSSLDVNPDNIESYAFQLSQMQGTRETYEILNNAKKHIEEGQDYMKVWGLLDLEGGKISSYAGIKTNNTKTVKEATESTIKGLIDAIDNKHLFISTGLSAWDDYVNGLFPKRLYIVAARAGRGKSTLCINLAYLLAIVGNVKTTYFTLESASEDIIKKMIQMMTGIDTQKIDRGVLSDNEKDEIYKAAKKLKESANLVLDDSSEIILPVLRSKIRKAVENGSKVIIIDQLEQILVGGGGDTTQAEYIKINYITYRLKAIAKELNVPIILVHQMKREIESGNNRGKDIAPQSSDLAQAGEKAPNAILMIARMKNGTFFYWVKNRDYANIGHRQVDFDRERITFKDIPGLSEFPDEAPNFKDDDDDDM